MLKYKLNISNFNDDNVKVDLESIALRDYFADEDIVEVVCEHDGTYNLNVGDELNVVSTHLRDIHPSGLYSIGDNIQKIIKSVDKSSNTFTFLGEKYVNLPITDISIVVENTVVYLSFSFSDWHYFRSADSGSIEIYAVFIGKDNNRYEKLFKRCIYENDNELKWRYDRDDVDIEPFMCSVFNNDYYVFVGYANLEDNVDEYETIEGDVPETACFSDPMYIKKSVNFNGCPKWELYEKVCSDGSLGGILIRRVNWKWQDINETTIYVNKITTSVPVPMSVLEEVNIHKENLISSRFVQEQVKNGKNEVVEMEKYVYHPVFRIQDDGFHFKSINTIKFNLHFREREKEGWIVKNGALWNGMDIISPRKFFSYQNLGADNDPEGRQSDLLTYLGFKDSDVKYQKSRLKKSFLRLSFYDSDNPANQNLLCYSTIYVDSGNLFSKMMRHSCGDAVYFISGNELPVVPYSDIKVDREPDNNIIGLSKNEELEDYRLSSQIVVRDSLLSDSSSEGFYLYLWSDNNNGAVPEDIFMKVEFNHAGYGRTIPFMLPYRDERDNERGIKTYEDIMSDWIDGNGYGIRLYQKYSYIKFKYCHDIESGRYVYYPDDTVYGNDAFSDNTPDELELNLYEANVNFGE